MDVCAENGLFLVNTFLQHNLIQRNTSRTRNEGEQKSMIDYIAMDERMKKDVLDAKVVRGVFDWSDHYDVVAKMHTSIRGR